MNLLYSYPVEFAMRYHAPSESMPGETGDGMQALGGWGLEIFMAYTPYDHNFLKMFAVFPEFANLQNTLHTYQYCLKQ